MKNMGALVVVLAFTGCADRDPASLNQPVKGPAATDVDRAMAVSWDAAMPETDRPSVTWFDNTACAAERIGAAVTMHAGPRCSEHWLDTSTGAISVGWHVGQKISNTGLGLALAEWKIWLWTSSNADIKLIHDESVAFDAQIAGAGL